MATAVSIEAVAGRQRSRRWATLLAAAAPVLFVGTQIALELEHQRLERAAVATRGLPELGHPLYDLSTGVGYSLIVYLAIAFGGIVLAKRGYRVAWAAPAAIFVLGAPIGAPHFPQPLGVGWNFPNRIGGIPVAHW